jgi:hypothetical protein
MSLSQIVGIGAGLLFVAFVLFCLRQGTKVRPRQGLSESPYAAGSSDHDGASHDGSSGH